MIFAAARIEGARKWILGGVPISRFLLQKLPPDGHRPIPISNRQRVKRGRKGGHVISMGCKLSETPAPPKISIFYRQQHTQSKPPATPDLPTTYCLRSDAWSGQEQGFLKPL